MHVSVNNYLNKGVNNEIFTDPPQVVYFTALFPYLVLFIFLIRGATLEGAGEGVLFYLKPDFSRLTDPKVRNNHVVNGIPNKVFFTPDQLLDRDQGNLYFLTECIMTHCCSELKGSISNHIILLMFHCLCSQAVVAIIHS